MAGRSKAWLCTFVSAYLLSACFLLFVYETYLRDLLVVGSGGISDAPLMMTDSMMMDSPARQRRRKTSAVLSAGASSALQQYSNAHTCNLRKNETTQLPMAPNLILAGAMKGGTSYFWYLLRKHPNFVPSRKFEAHFFDWQFAVPPKDIDSDEFWDRFASSATHTREEQICAARKKYIEENFDPEELLNNNPQQPSSSVITYEKTPNYMFLPQIPQLVRRICPWNPKIILILRDPVDRAYSQFVMDSDKDSVDLSFEEYIQLELNEMRRYGLIRIPEIPTDKWDDLSTERDAHLFEPPPVLSAAPFSLKQKKGRRRKTIAANMTREEVDHANWMVYRQRHMRNYLQRGIYHIQLERWKEYFALNQSLMVINNDHLLKEPRQVMRQVMDFLGAPQPDFYSDESVSVTVEKKSRQVKSISNLLSVGGYEPMQSETRRFLEMFYKPYNQQLGDVLGEEWRGMWDY